MNVFFYKHLLNKLVCYFAVPCAAGAGISSSGIPKGQNPLVARRVNTLRFESKFIVEKIKNLKKYAEEKSNEL
ncbi:MAG: hypothetical protein A2Y62_13460 [Candidatus Fischerbacteria bacterium RBG_13_37_8]|uniref:Uncharacterized protein n=1 Tax=Candidatus Fischerbacteria bacterium RBG_13_37_8 TaxID=1817863 RepID=A0A1F5VLV2_9BACT|nr:MAG: hypothetical protein A2Y62_13460 [Candidatus Fischerbacteria bacterium RBG_13_37_8]